MGQVDVRAMLKMYWKRDLPLNLGAVCPCWLHALCALTRAVAPQMGSLLPCQLPWGSGPLGTRVGCRGGCGGAQPVHVNLRAVASVARIKAGGSQPGLVEWFAAISAAPGETLD